MMPYGTKIVLVIIATGNSMLTYYEWDTGTDLSAPFWCTAGLILGLCPANGRQHYFVTTSLIGWAQAKNQPCKDPVWLSFTKEWKFYA